MQCKMLVDYVLYMCVFDLTFHTARLILFTCHYFRINAWTRSRRRGSGERAEAILQRLLTFHNDGNSDVRPDARSFSHIIDYYSRGREPEAATRAEWLLLAMIKLFLEGYQEVLPNVFTFTAVINAHMKSNDPDAGRHAERIVQYMYDLHDDHGLSKLAPNTFVMNALLNCWSKCGDPNAGIRAEEIVLQCEKEYKNGNHGMRPNTRMYGYVSSSLSLCEPTNYFHSLLTLFVYSK